MEMTPIISPWFFYLLSISTGIKILFGVITLIFIGATVVKLIDADSYMPDSEGLKSALKRAKEFFIIAIVFAILTILVPDDKTCVQMLIADNITYERLEVVGKTVEDIYGDILDFANKMVENKDVSK
jgi:hypothetical protein